MVRKSLEAFEMTSLSSVGEVGLKIEHNLLVDPLVRILKILNRYIRIQKFWLSARSGSVGISGLKLKCMLILPDLLNG